MSRMVRDGVVETPSEVWKTSILAVIRIPLVKRRNYNRYTLLLLRNQAFQQVAKDVGESGSDDAQNECF